MAGRQRPLFALAAAAAVLAASAAGTAAHAEPGSLAVSYGGTDYLVQYNATNMSVTGSSIDEAFKALTLGVNVGGPGNGTLEITLDRALIDAREGGSDTDFVVVYGEGEEADATEVAATASNRTIRFALPAGTDEVSIVGTVLGADVGGAGAPGGGGRDAGRPAMGLQGMLDGAAPGSTVAIPAGVHRDANITISKPLTLTADPPGSAVLTGNSRIAVEPSTSGPIVVSGIAFRDTSCAPQGGNATIAVAGHPSGNATAPVTIRNNTFAGTCSAAVSAQQAAASAPPPSGSGANSTGGPQGAPPPASYVMIAGNTFRGVGAGVPGGQAPPPAIRLGAAPPPASGMQVANSSVSSNYMFDSRGPAVQVAGAGGVSITGNHIEGAGSSGIRIVYNSSDVRVAGNTIINAAEAAVDVWADSSGVTIMGNRISESAGALSVCAASCTADGATADASPAPGAEPAVRFHHNTLYGSNEGGRLITSGGTAQVDARLNYYPGYRPAPGQFGGAVAYEPAMPDGAAPLRIGSLLAATDMPYLDGVYNAAAMGEAVEWFNLGQVDAGTNASIELVGADLRLADPLAAVGQMASGKDDAGNYPVMHNQILWMRGMLDENGRDAALQAIRGLSSPQEHYPFAISRTGQVLANGANPDRIGVISPIASEDNPVPFSEFLEMLDAAAPGTALWYDYNIPNFVREGTPIESKRSLLALHSSGDGGAAGDLIIGAGYYPHPVNFSVGPSADSAVSAARDLASREGLVLVSPRSTSPGLVAADGIYRMAPGDGHRAPLLARAMADDGVVGVVALVQNDTYGSGAYELISEEFGGQSAGSAAAAVRFSPSAGPAEWPAVARAANDAAVAASAGGRAAVLYIGHGHLYAALAAEAVKYPALAGIRWYSADAAGSGAVLDSGAALDLAASTGLKAVAFAAPEPNERTRAVDAAIAAHPGGRGAAPTGYAYAAHDAVVLLGSALAAGIADAESLAAGMRGLAANHTGALGRISFDAGGDLAAPRTFSTWTVSPDARGWAASAPVESAAGTCSISLGSPSIDFGSVQAGQASAPGTQTVSNTGSEDLVGLYMSATDWSNGLPAGSTVFRLAAADPAAPFAPISQNSTLLGRGDALPPGMSVAVEQMLDLAGADASAAQPGTMAQTITYTFSCGR